MLAGALIPPNSWSNPQAPSIYKGFEWYDWFNREAITPTGFPTLYTAANNGGGAATISTSPYKLSLTTSGVGAGDDVDVRTSGLRFIISPVDQNTIGGINRVITHIVFGSTGVTNQEFFVGLAVTAQLSALPTNQIHMGIQYDASASANMFFTEADGTNQTTTDTTIAASTGLFILEIDWKANNSNVLNLYNSSGVLQATRTTTRAQGTTTGQAVHFFVQTEAAAAKQIDIYQWKYKCY